jgi:hypothetical protein
VAGPQRDRRCRGAGWCSHFEIGEHSIARRTNSCASRVEVIKQVGRRHLWAQTPAQREKPAPALKLNFLSHGTLESRDLTFSRRFYEEFLGLEVIQTSPMSLLIRLGGPNTIAVVYSKNVGGMNLLNHNGLDVRTREEVDEAHRIVCAQAEQWHLKKSRNRIFSTALTASTFGTATIIAGKF